MGSPGGGSPLSWVLVLDSCSSILLHFVCFPVIFGSSPLRLFFVFSFSCVGAPGIGDGKVGAHPQGAAASHRLANFRF